MDKPTTTVKLDIGDMVALIAAPRPEIVAHIRDRYHAFLSDKKPDFEIEMALAEDVSAAGFLGVPREMLLEPSGCGSYPRAAESWGPEPGTESADSQATSKPHVAHLDGLILLQRSDFAGCLDLKARQGKNIFGRTMGPFAVESFLRISYSFLAVEHGGLLLHSAGALRDGRGYIFPGQSGTGKSTIAGLATPRETILSDEMVVVRKKEESYLVYSTPFYGTNPSAGRNIAAPLRAAFLPVKDQAVYLKEAKPAQVLSKLLASVLFFGQEPALSRRLMDIGADVVARVPFYEMHFRRDGSFWECIAELEKTEVVK